MINLVIAMWIFFSFWTGEILIREIIDSPFSVYEFLIKRPITLLVFLFFIVSGPLGFIAILTARWAVGEKFP